MAELSAFSATNLLLQKSNLLLSGPLVLQPFAHDQSLQSQLTAKCLCKATGANLLYKPSSFKNNTMLRLCELFVSAASKWRGNQ